MSYCHRLRTNYMYKVGTKINENLKKPIYLIPSLIKHNFYSGQDIDP